MSRRCTGFVALVAALFSLLGCTHALPPAPPAPSGAAVVASAPPLDATYHLRAVVAGPNPWLDVHACFRAPTGSVLLDLPSAHWGEDGFARTIVDLRATSSGTVLTEAPQAGPGEPLRRMLSSPPGSTACIAYRVVTGQGARTESEAHWPTFAVDRFYFFAFATFLVPSTGPGDLRRVAVTWDGLPAAWSHGSNLGERADEGEAVSVTVDDLLDTVFFAGDYRVHTFDVRGKPVRFATRGHWARSDAELASAVQRILGAERAFFRDDTTPTYLVVLSPYGHFDDFGGEALPNAFAAYASPEMYSVPVGRGDISPDERLFLLLAHEMFHTWNGHQAYRTRPDGVLYWMSEGFTDFFSRRILLGTGLMDFGSYVRSYDEVLARYDLSLVKTAPNSRVSGGFWKDAALEKLPYQRGDILAHRWNMEILRQSGGRSSLDDAMRALRAEVLAHGPLTDEARFLAVMRQLIPGGVDRDVQTYITEGAPIARSDGDLGPCARQAPIELRAFVRGFSRAASEKSGKITGVVAGSNAARAGLKDGMTLRKLDPSNDPETPTDLLVEDRGVLRHIVYLPSSPPVATRTFELVAPPPAPEVCLQGIGLSPR